MKNRKKSLGIAMLLSAAIIWGSAFSAQSIIARYIEAYTYMAVRSWISFGAMIPAVYFLKKKRGDVSVQKNVVVKAHKKEVFMASLCSGFFLFGASAVQQIGIKGSTASKAGFITALYVIIVPLISIIFLRIKEGKRIWISVLLSVTGMSLLCLQNGFILQRGDLILLVSAVLYALQIITVGYFVVKVDVLDLSKYQFLTAAILSSIIMLIVEKPGIEMIIKALPALIFVGLFSGAAGYTLQNIGQLYVSPSIASLLMSLESVFSAIFAWIILGELLNVREIFGATLMFTAIIIAQIPISPKSPKTGG